MKTEAVSAICDVLDDNPESLRVVRSQDQRWVADLLGAQADREAVEKAEALLVVTAHDDLRSLAEAGEILDRLLLTLAAEGLPYLVLKVVAERRSALQTLIVSARPPQAIVCVGVETARNG